MNIILRILIAKGQHDYVHRILHDRKELVNTMKNRRAVSRAVTPTGKRAETEVSFIYIHGVLTKQFHPIFERR